MAIFVSKVCEFRISCYYLCVYLYYRSLEVRVFYFIFVVYQNVLASHRSICSQHYVHRISSYSPSYRVHAKLLNIDLEGGSAEFWRC